MQFCFRNSIYKNAVEKNLTVSPPRTGPTFVPAPLRASGALWFPPLADGLGVNVETSPLAWKVSRPRVICFFPPTQPI